MSTTRRYFWRENVKRDVVVLFIPKLAISDKEKINWLFCPYLCWLPAHIPSAPNSPPPPGPTDRGANDAGGDDQGVDECVGDGDGEEEEEEEEEEQGG
jgi:hypothetical protein